MDGTDRHSTDGIEITPEMIEAGRGVLIDLISWGGDNSGFFDSDGFVESDEVIRRIYLAMAGAGSRPELV